MGCSCDATDLANHHQDLEVSLQRCGVITVFGKRNLHPFKYRTIFLVPAQSGFDLVWLDQCTVCVVFICSPWL